MTTITAIAPLLNHIAALCDLEFHVHQDGTTIFSAFSSGASIKTSERQAVIARFSQTLKPFHVELAPNGPVLCGAPLKTSQGSPSWLVTIVPHDICGGIQDAIMPMLMFIIKMINDQQAQNHEKEEMAKALDDCFEELALYRHIQNALPNESTSPSEMRDILRRLRQVYQTDLIFSSFSSATELNAQDAGNSIKERLDLDKFVPELIDCITKASTATEEPYLIINNSLNDPLFAPLSARPFRLMAARGIHQQQNHGWIGVVSFNYYSFFKHNQLNMLQAAASKAAAVEANNHLLQGLEKLTDNVDIFQKEIVESPDTRGTDSVPSGRTIKEFLDQVSMDLSNATAATRSLMMRSAQMANTGKLAAVFAHEIKQPVCALDGFIQIAKLKQTAPEEEQSLNMMGKAIKRINRIIRRFESFSKPHEVQFKPLSINIIAREVYHLITPQLEFKKIKGRFDRDMDLPDIIGDAQSLQQAVLNLASNAICAMASNNGRGAELGFTTYRSGRFVCLDVTDNGEGIPNDQIDKVTRPYFTTKSPDKGTGLGLAVVKQVVEQHDGQLEIESTRGNGSRFSLKIPVPTRQHWPNHPRPQGQDPIP